MAKKRIGERANGRWKAIFEALGFDRRILDGQHHPCPVTGEGDDRFRFSNHKGKGNFFCACNDGKSDGFKLLECRFGADFKAGAEMVEGVIEDVDEDEIDSRTTEHAIRDLQMIQSKVKACTTSEAVVDYLTSRGIPVDRIPIGAVRQAKLNYGLRAAGIHSPHTAMVVKVVTADNKPSTFHMTYLDEENRKLGIDRARIVATPAVSMTGGAVRLYPMTGDGILGVAEGVETAISARVLYDVPVWATLNAQMMEQFVPPPGCRTLHIFADNDATFTGQAAAYKLAKQCRMKHGVETVVVHVPLREGDYNDVLKGGA